MADLACSLYVCACVHECVFHECVVPVWVNMCAYSCSVLSWIRKGRGVDRVRLRGVLYPPSLP